MNERFENILPNFRKTRGPSVEVYFVTMHQDNIYTGVTYSTKI
jgi:hypothetical protein